MNQKTTFLALAAALTLGACSQESQPPEPPLDSQARQVTLPEGFFLDAVPPGAVPLSRARAEAQAGEPVAFTGYIGGRSQPFTKGRALFLVADIEKAPPCTDGCPAPWDACCTPSDAIIAQSATVQVVDTAGMPLHLDLEGRNGLAPGALVTVIGKVREATPSLLIVDATAVALGGAAH